MTTNPTTSDLQAALDDAQLLLYRDRRRAHATLFGGAKRKANITPEFHWDMIDDFHSSIPNLLQVAFRGAAKSTLGEEGVTVKALFREFRYCLIVSSTSEIAEMRLHAIKRQFETNENILELFGNLKARPWEDNQIELSTGIVFRAVGRGQAIRGGKDEDARPDFIFPDDIEDLKAVATEAQLKKTLAWFDGELVGSADAPNLKIRMLANDMGPDCLASKLKKSQAWVTKVYPWIVKDDQGKQKSIWEDRYPLAKSLAVRADMYARGSGDEYEREYMCSSERPESKTFRDDLLKVDARVRVYEPVYAMIVPEPQQTGLHVSPCAIAVWSWVNGKVIVWELSSRNLSASEIVKAVEDIDQSYGPVKIGFEHRAYQDWARASLGLGHLPNIDPIKKTADEIDFVRAMQPFFVAKQIIFAADPHETWGQFLSFPHGPTEAPTALAFAFHPALRDNPIYEDFQNINIAPDMTPENGAMMVALNASPDVVTGALCQVSGKGLRIYADWIMTGDAIDVAPRIVQQANLTAQRRCQVVMPRRHFERGKDRVSSALRRMGIQANLGGGTDEGRTELRRLLRQQSKGIPSILVAQEARWVTNGFLGGFSISDDSGIYATMFEGVEATAALMRLGESEDDSRNNATTRDGRDYFSARPVKQDA